MVTRTIERLVRHALRLVAEKTDSGPKRRVYRPTHVLEPSRDTWLIGVTIRTEVTSRRNTPITGEVTPRFVLSRGLADQFILRQRIGGLPNH